eukprot:TRINITY_DN9416_c0_g3_i1.p1 TRINITY_DN9416_c0_g3~~TRINITY_DN9416_c0_g3_i1.p1  ORF type:complete len:422 (-),score=67.18 TRINITY_DN9416_c0_g3_i1:797-2062(-)
MQLPLAAIRLLFFIHLISTLLLSGNSNAACSSGNCRLMDPCSSSTDCAPSLYCGNCPATGENQPTCIRGQAILPTSIAKGLPFNKYTWLVTHNSFSIVNFPSLTGIARVTFYNQEDSVTNQLRNGVRGLMLDMYDFEDDIWLCHSMQGQCYNFTAFEPAINTLKEVEAFLTENPSEIVTIIIEDYVHAPKGLTRLFTDAGLLKYWFPVSQMPANGRDWPTVTDMIAKNYRLVVFTSVASKEADEGIAYQWRYMVENEPGDGGIAQGSCSNRKESQPLKSRNAGLFLQNYFPTFPSNSEDACKEHSTSLAETVDACYKAAGNIMPNFLAVNFYMRSDGGGVFDAMDKMNGQTLCGCNTVLACQAGAPAGLCKNAGVGNRNPATVAGTYNGTFQFVASASPSQFSYLLVFNLFLFSLMVLQLL